MPDITDKELVRRKACKKKSLYGYMFTSSNYQLDLWIVKQIILQVEGSYQLLQKEAAAQVARSRRQRQDKAWLQMLHETCSSICMCLWVCMLWAAHLKARDKKPHGAKGKSWVPMTPPVAGAQLRCTGHLPARGQTPTCTHTHKMWQTDFKKDTLIQTNVHPGSHIWKLTHRSFAVTYLFFCWGHTLWV